MRIIYTDENKRLRDFGLLMDSKAFQSYMRSNLFHMQKYSYGMSRTEPYLAKQALNRFFEEHGFKIGDKSKHAHGIGNNNMNYIQDLFSREYIGAIHLNTDMFSGMYCYATDINENKVSNTYLLHPDRMQIKQKSDVDWSKYSFAKELEALVFIQEAINVGVLHRGENDGVMVCKVFHGYEAWEETSLDDAAKDLVEKGQVEILKTAIDERKQANELFELYYKCYLQKYCTEQVLEVDHKMVDGKLHFLYRDEYDPELKKHIIFLDENGELQIQNQHGESIYDYAEEHGWNENDVYYMKHGHEPSSEKLKTDLKEQITEAQKEKVDIEPGKDHKEHYLDR